MISLNSRPPGNIELVELTHFPVFRLGCFHQRSRTFNIMIIKQLISICQSFIFRNPVERCDGLLPLLQIVVINRRNDEKFGERIIQPECFVTISKQVTLFTNTFHALKRTVTIIIKFFVHSRPLTDFHQSDVGNQQFEFIFSQFIYFLMQRFRPVKVHSHKSTESQVIGCFRFPRLVEIHLPIGFIGVFIRRIQASITISIRFPV